MASTLSSSSVQPEVREAELQVRDPSLQGNNGCLGAVFIALLVLVMKWGVGALDVCTTASHSMGETPAPRPNLTYTRSALAPSLLRMQLMLNLTVLSVILRQR